MKRSLQWLFAAALAVALPALANPGTPAGLWKTIDDKTKQERSLVRIVEVNGVYEGRIEKILNRQPDDDPDNLCRACTGERKDKAILGMTILWGLKKDGESFGGGEILDPKNGKTYRCKMKVSSDGRTLDVRGYIGVSLIGRTQTWIREQ
ncbi:MAG: DUF2147 domain-containing protein [Betaproteobacteria bacterium]|jgi:uncharacterized protein (DUF2147 family)|nr:DUF2147 domain-containing protein [Rhodocyclaceae bacterium]MCA3142967.1 DUF2147 domain-containing protein [Rhodocyclaceae bacterium]